MPLPPTPPQREAQQHQTHGWLARQEGARIQDVRAEMAALAQSWKRGDLEDRFPLCQNKAQPLEPKGVLLAWLLSGFPFFPEGVHT